MHALGRFDPSDYVDASTITRLLVVSYFIALALKLVDGSNIDLLATPFLSDPAAHLTMRCVVLILSAMILFDVLRRPAALILALIVFWPSYMTLYAGGDVSAFWRDLALIGGLVMSARGSDKAPMDEDEVLTAREQPLEISDPVLETPTDPADDGVYREDLNLARSV